MSGYALRADPTYAFFGRPRFFGASSSPLISGSGANKAWMSSSPNLTLPSWSSARMPRIHIPVVTE